MNNFALLRSPSYPVECGERLPVVLLIVLLHMVLIFGWTAGRHTVPDERGPVLLPIWNAIEPRPLENKPEEKKPQSKRPVGPASHLTKPLAGQQASAAPATDIPPPGEAETSNPQAIAPAAGTATRPAPRLDYDSIRNQALEIDKHREITPAERLQQEHVVPHTVESGMADAAKRGTRSDCQTAYAGAGLLAIIPLAIDTVTGHGCKWK